MPMPSENAEIIEATRSAFIDTVKASTGIESRIIWYGAVHLVSHSAAIWVMVETDAQKERIDRDEVLISQLRGLLLGAGYPPYGAEKILIGAESYETIDRDSDGDLRRHFQ